MALVAIDKVKAFLGITDAAEDGQLAIWIAQADAEIKDYCGRDIEQTTYPGAAGNGRGDSGFYSGDDSPFLRLRQTPVTSITSLYVDNTGRFGQNPDGNFPTSALLVYGTDYALHWDGCLPGSSTPCSYSGLLERIPGVWTGSIRRRVGEINARYVPAIGNIKIAYVAGYNAVPPAVEAAACKLVALIRRTAPYGGQNVQSETLGAHSISLSAPTAGSWPELASIRSDLARYKRVDV